MLGMKSMFDKLVADSWKQLKDLVQGHVLVLLCLNGHDGRWGRESESKSVD